MFLNVDQLEKQLEKEEFQEIESMASLNIRDTVLDVHQVTNMSIDERVKHKQELNSWVNEIQMLTTEDKVYSSKELDVSLVDTKSSGTTLKEKDTSSRLGNDAHAND
ncbi:hypothetical protein Tco_0060430, partial [Tanacetum coccineum]